MEKDEILDAIETASSCMSEYAEVQYHISNAQRLLVNFDRSFTFYFIKNIYGKYHYYELSKLGITLPICYKLFTEWTDEELLFNLRYIINSLSFVASLDWLVDEKLKTAIKGFLKSLIENN